MTDAPVGESQQADLVAQKSAAKPTANPFAHTASISVSVPETVEIKLVDASALADYEVWTFLTSILASSLTGFGVAALQSEGQPIQKTLIAVSAVTLLLLIICAAMARSKRNKLTARTKRLKFRVGDLVDE
jgi:hypothetical protein